MQVLQHEHQGLAGGDLLDELGHALEQGQGTVARRRQAGPACLGQETGQLGPPRGMQGAEDLLVGADLAAAAGVDPGSEGEDRVTLVAAANQDPASLGQRVRHQGADQPRLADARLAHHRGHVSVPPDGLTEQLSQPPQFRLPPEQGCLRRREIGWSRPGLPRAASAIVRSSVRSLLHLGRAPEQFLIELPRLRLGLCPQLPLQRADAHLVLLERGSPPPLADIEPHERAVHGLLQGIQPEQPHRRLNGVLRGRGLALLGQQPRQGLQRHLPQPLPLGDEPLLEQRLVHREAQQQVPAVQLGRLLQRLGSPLGHPLFERHHVDLHPEGIQRQGLTFDPQRRGVGTGQRPA